MEGPLSKWTNVVHGWQNRWFVLNDESICYYTSKEKMLKRQQRGCIRLRGAVIGIDGENTSLFTLTVDGKVFHLQGRDENDRNKWVRALEATIHKLSGYYLPSSTSNTQLLKTKINEAEKIVKKMINEVKDLENASLTAEPEQKKLLSELIKSSNSLLDSVRQAIVLLQMAKSRIGINSAEKTDSEDDAKNEEDVPLDVVAPLSYSSSDEEFFDAPTSNDIEIQPGSLGDKLQPVSKTSVTSVHSEFADDDETEDYDALYNDTEESDVGNMQQHGSVLMHLLSQVSVGMDLTKVTLPTFILERRSLLEMYADFFAYPDNFVNTTSLATPEERMISVVKYYLGAFYAARKSGVAKKPYNPILGETFRCRWNVPGLPMTGIKTTRGPFPGSDLNQLTFIAEQVSHHPPVSAFYAEHPGKKISLNAHIWTKSSFLGLSIGVTNVGWGCVKLYEHNEDYMVTFPNGYGRSIMGTPWFELGGKVTVTCPQTGYYAEVDFLTKPFFGGKPHRIIGNIYRPCFKKPILSLKGEWNGVITAKPLVGNEYLFINVKEKDEVKKECIPVMQQGNRESRKLWRHVTLGLKRNKISMATNAKRAIEQRQRDEAKIRQDEGTTYETLLFIKEGDDWCYKDQLVP
uniref:Oxysterol-binding protein n=1 Tax=Syphacia muris TaxID=451379 RepID=A0A158R5I6_9BILA